jgi:phage shock protein C
MNDRLYRSRDERVISGVAGGLAERFDLDPSLVRVAWAILTVLSGGVFLLIYIVMAIVVPEAPAGYRRPDDPWAGQRWPTTPPAPPAPGAVPGWWGPSGGPAAGAGAGMGTPPSTTPAQEPGDGGTAAGTVDGDAAAGSAGDAAAFTAGAAASAGAPAWTSPTGPTWPAGWDARAARRAERAARRAERRGGMFGPFVVGAFLIVLGGYFLLGNIVPSLDLSAYWPAILVGFGVLLLVGSIRLGPEADK